MTALVLSRPDPREAMNRALAKVAAASRDHRRAVILRCADAMGAERALAIADFNRRPCQSRMARLKDLARAERAAIRQRGHSRPMDVSPVREYLAAMVWVWRVEVRNRAFVQQLIQRSAA